MTNAPSTGPQSVPIPPRIATKQISSETRSDIVDAGST